MPFAGHQSQPCILSIGEDIRQSYDDLRNFYQHLRDRGKPDKVAAVAVARKLPMDHNAVVHGGTP